VRIPKQSGKLGGWAEEIIGQCDASRQYRIEECRKWRAYYLQGNYSSDQACYNRIFSHVDRLSSFLFSADDVRFTIEFDDEYGKEWQRHGQAAARKLNREFHRRGVDLQFGAGVDWALVKGKTLLKLLWGHNGLEPWLVQPEFFAVLREDIDGLDRQEAFVHTTFISKSELERQLSENPDGKKLADEIAKKWGKPGGEDLEMREQYFHQVVVGGINPVAQNTPTGAKGNVGTSPLMPSLSPDVLMNLVRVDELWVEDSERDDYTTIRLVGDVVIDGNLRHRNAMSPFDGGTKDDPGENPLRGEQPFIEICPNPVEGYFWGQSEIMQIAGLQEGLNDAIDDIDRLTKLQAQPPTAFIGFSGMNEQRYKALMVPRGFMAEENPNGKIEKMAPEIPKEIFEKVEKYISWMDDVGGFAPIMMGQGEPGVRAGTHAQTLVRTGSPRMRDRALLVERQCTVAGDLSFKYLQAKDAKVYLSKGKGGGPGEHFLLAQLPDDYRIAVDSHSGSPVFHEDTTQLAFALAKARAIRPKNLIMLTRPPHMDTLMEDADEMERAEAQMIQQHPELLSKGKKGGH
jgi:hypothetical protein